MKLGIRNSQLGLNKRPGTRYPGPGAKASLFRAPRSAFRISIIMAVLLLLTTSGCLFTRPFTPSARLVPENQICSTMSSGYTGYSMDTEDVYQTPSTYEYVNGRYVRIPGAIEITKSTLESKLLFFDFGWRTRITGSNVEIGVNLANFGNLAMDIKYSFSDQKNDTALIALCASLSLGIAPYTSYGFSIGPVLNLNLVRSTSFDLVISGHYQFSRTDAFASMSYSSSYDADAYTVNAPSESSAYFYAGFEFAMDNGTVIAPGVSYSYFIDSPYQPQLISAGLTVKTGGAINKEKKQKINKREVAAREYGYETAAIEPAGAVDFVQEHTEPVLTPDNYIGAAEILLKAGLVKEASDELNLGLEKYPEEYTLNLMQGFCLSQLGNKRAAYGCYRRALAMDPNNKELKESVKTLWKEINRR